MAKSKNHTNHNQCKALNIAIPMRVSIYLAGYSQSLCTSTFVSYT